MKRFIKIIAGCLLFLLLILVITPLVFKGKIKDIVLKEANKSLNAKMEVGKLSISFLRSFPNARLDLNDILITGTGAFINDTLVKVKSLQATTSIMDLLAGSPYQIKKIKIGNPDLRLKVLADGQVNWDIVKPAEDDEKAIEGKGGEEGFVLKLRSLLIDDLRFVYDDIQYNTYILLEGTDHQLSGDLSADFTSLSTMTSISKAFFSYDGIVYLRDAAVNWNADLDADLVRYIYTFKDNKLTINGFPLIFDGSLGLPDEGYDLDLSFATPDNTFKQLLSLVPDVFAKDFASVRTDGKMGFNGFVKGRYVGDQYPSFLINLNVKDAWFQYPDLPAAVNNINIVAKIESPGGDLDKMIIDIQNLGMDLAGNPLRGRLYLKNPMTDPYIDTRIEANINLSDVKRFYPLAEGEDISGQIDADITLKGRLSDLENQRYSAFEASGKFNSAGIEYSTSYLAQDVFIEKAVLTITPACLDIPELRIKSGKSDFSLNGKLENYLAYYLKDEVLTGNLNLRSAMIDVNELLAFPEVEDNETTDTSGLSAFIVPAGIDFTLGVAVTSVRYMDYDISNLAGKISIRDQKLILDGISMSGMGGRLQMDGSYASTDPGSPVIDFDLGIKDISIKETFKQISLVERFAPVAEKIAGDFSGRIKLSGLLSGNMMPRLETLTGAGDLATSPLRIENVNTLDQLSGALRMDQLRELQVAGARIIVEFLDGVMEVKPFDFKALGIDMNLGGQTALDQKIGYVLKMKIPRELMGGAANNVLNDLVSKAGQAGVNIQPGDYINVDALIDGTITDPRVRLNLAGTGKDLVESVKEQVKEQAGQKVEELKEDAKEEAQKILDEADLKAQAILDQAGKQSDEVLKAAQSLADEAKKQASVNADKIVKEAKGKGYVAEMAAKKSAEEVIRQGDKQAQNILSEAQKQSASILVKASQEADRIKAEAREKVK